MALKEVITKGFKQILEMVIIIGIVTFNMDPLFKQSIWSNLCTALMILMSMAGLFVVFRHLSNKQNNKANVISIGYVIISILLILKFYYDEFVHLEIQGFYSNGKGQFIIDLLEVIYILIGIKCVTQSTNIKKYIVFSMMVLISAILVIYRIDFLELLSINYDDGKVIIIGFRIFLLFLTMSSIVVCYNINDVCYSINKIRLLFVLILQCIYQCSYLLLHNQPYGIVSLTLGILKVIIYGSVFLFIYHDTLWIIWRRIDDDLEVKKRKLADDNKQKSTLTLVSQKLQEYVEQIDDITRGLQIRIEEADDAKKLKYVNMIKQNGYRLKKLTHNIVAMNQIETGELLPHFMLVDIVEVMQQVIESIEPYANSMHIHIELIQSKNKLYCYIDTDLIERVMLNLLSNAIKYNKKNGTIVIYVNTRKDNVYLCIKDTGIGIPSDKLATIFNRFERGDSLIARTKEGSGLGLPIVKSLIEAHRGTICIISKENYGTTVSIEFPRYKGITGESCHYGFINKEGLADKIKIEFSDL